ncbi:Nif3-like dinuclear metal center hexameric protein [Cupriavidus sp. AU9028]|uniref:Nif3-like dinuclear metal center hexameric protein n=1 Tax=Cupriavidus sp. AU9028 TaxID=2871157 RepID=UPI001C979C55|nr:Nif3-like dinuclear metal center hexameric protein [Cupriavidus sp. AU9028]MBY4898301.1 Nif3-like dinuclear metal center hexameric protein [Cupriavidus sp. AU9028]
MKSKELELYLNDLLEVPRYKDYCPNGLQVQGRVEIEHIVTGVTASAALLDAAIEANADAILVHHGYFWRGEDPRVIGQKHGRLKRLLTSDTNLFAYHLPLDSHPELGNNAQLARELGLVPTGRFGDNDMCWSGRLPQPMDLHTFAEHVGAVLGRQPLVLGSAVQPVQTIGWCTGGAQGYFDAAVAAGVDVYISGEASEQTTHLANESGVAYLAAGHHATERFGIRAVGEHLAATFGLRHTFIDLPNPV